MVWAALEAVGILVSVAQPSRVRNFAKARGVFAKTDGLDAGSAAYFGAAVEPAPTPLPSAELQQYRALLRQLNYLVEQRAQFRTRRHSVDAAARRGAASTE